MPSNCKITSFDDFESAFVESGRGTVSCRIGGSGAAVLLLHGFPETHLMWRGVAPLLTDRFTVIAADLPGYGKSACPGDTGDDHRAMSKRAVAADSVQAMRTLGHDRFAVVGHDRGGRVAYRMALDAPEAISSVSRLPVSPKSPRSAKLSALDPRR